MLTTTDPVAPRDLVGLRDAAARMDVSERFMRRLVNERRIEHYKIGKLLKFSRKDLDEFVRAGWRPALGRADG